MSIRELSGEGELEVDDVWNIPLNLGQLQNEDIFLQFIEMVNIRGVPVEEVKTTEDGTDQEHVLGSDLLVLRVDKSL